MPIDPKFKRQTDDYVVQMLESYKEGGDSALLISHTWNCDNAGDFLCGFFVGEMTDSAVKAFQIVHKREPTSIEYAEIITMVRSHSEEIEDFFLRFN